MDKSIDFAASPTAPYVITAVEARPSTIAGLKLFDIRAKKGSLERRLVIYSRDGDALAIGFHLIHKRLRDGHAAMWSSDPGAGDGRLLGGGFTIGSLPATWKSGAAA